MTAEAFVPDLTQSVTSRTWEPPPEVQTLEVVEVPPVPVDADDPFIAHIRVMLQVATKE